MFTTYLGTAMVGADTQAMSYLQYYYVLALGGSTISNGVANALGGVGYLFGALVSPGFVFLFREGGLRWALAISSGVAGVADKLLWIFATSPSAIVASRFFGGVSFGLSSTLGRPCATAQCARFGFSREKTRSVQSSFTAISAVLNLLGCAFVLAFQSEGSKSTVLRADQAAATLALTGPAIVFLVLHAVYAVVALAVIVPDEENSVLKRHAVHPFREMFGDLSNFEPSTGFGRCCALFW